MPIFTPSQNFEPKRIPYLGRNKNAKPLILLEIYDSIVDRMHVIVSRDKKFQEGV